MRTATSLPLGLLPVLLLTACASAPPHHDQDAQRRALSLLLPDRIQIVEPFTRITSFDSDKAPDGIELLLRAVNAMDNPDLMITGHVRVELYEYVPASGNRTGRRLEQWDIELTTPQQQREHWNPLTQMYEFRLGVDRSNVPPADKYVLTVTYRSPLGEHLADEFVIGARPADFPYGEPDPR